MTTSDSNARTERSCRRPLLVLRAVVGNAPLTFSGPDDAQQPPLSERLQIALADWSDFFADIDGDLDDSAVADEFVGQGFKIAHRIRAECKGCDVDYIHPVSGECIAIRPSPRSEQTR